MAAFRVWRQDNVGDDLVSCHASAFLRGAQHCFGAGGDAQLGKDVGGVVAHGFLGHIQVPRDLLVAFCVTDQPQDRRLAIGQVVLGQT